MPAKLSEVSLSVENRVELRALCNMLELASGFTLIVVCGVFSGTGLLRKSFPQARRRGGFVEISALPLPC